MKRATVLFYYYYFYCYLFQSTPSVKRATYVHIDFCHHLSYFNPHPLWRGRRQKLIDKGIPDKISIHTLCEEGDLRKLLLKVQVLHFNPHPLWRGRQVLKVLGYFLPIFQSTPSVKRATHGGGGHYRYPSISIHTLCEEGDAIGGTCDCDMFYFNPHPLWRGRRAYLSAFFWVYLFQSTPSVKRATPVTVITHNVHNVFQSTPSVKRATR